MNKNENIQSAGANSAKLQNSSNNNNIIEALKQQQNDIFKAQKEERIKDKNLFPIEVFPERKQLIINELNDKNRFPIEFTSSAMLFAMSVIIGNSIKVKTINGWIEPPMLYISIIAPPGSIKSAPLSTILKPLLEIDNKNFEIFEKQKKEYDEALKNKNEETTNLERPYYKQLLLQDFTIESLPPILKVNKNGVGIYIDEIKAFFENFNRYNKGSEEQQWLSIYNAKPLKVNRKIESPQNVKSPFVSIIGTIQPEEARKVFESRRTNGLTGRFLFIFPKDSKKEYLKLDSIEESLLNEWSLFIDNSIDVISSLENKIISFKEEALKKLTDYLQKLVDLENEAIDKEEKSIYPKFDYHVIRLSLIVECIDCIAYNRPIESIKLESIEKAIKLSDYFLHNALKFNNYLSGNINPLEELAENHKIFYNDLPEEFTTAEAHKLAEKLKTFGKDQCNRFLRSRTQKGNKKSANDLFKDVKHGVYKKIY